MISGSVNTKQDSGHSHPWVIRNIRGGLKWDHRQPGILIPVIEIELLNLSSDSEESTWTYLINQIPGTIQLNALKTNCANLTLLLTDNIKFIEQEYADG